MKGPIVRIVATMAVLSVGVLATAQVPRSRIYSRPATPSSEVLRRLNLNLAWQQSVPMDGPRDSFLAIHMDHRDVFVLTRSGLVARLDGTTGRLVWKTRVGKAYTVNPYLAFNRHSVYVVASSDLHGINRTTGNIEWEESLLSGLASGMVADDEQLYVPHADGTLTAYVVPGGRMYREIESARGVKGQPRPKVGWSEATSIELSFAPVLTDDSLLVVSPGGFSRGYAAFAREGFTSNLLYRFEADGKVSAMPGQYDDRAYLPSEDGNMYALGIYDGKLAWRYVAGSGINRTPAGFERDVFVTSRREGMARLDTETGRARWAVPVGKRLSITNPAADQFLAASRQYVYARDRTGRVLVLDHKRGVTLSMVDWVDFRVPVTNTYTDRLFLAANDGTILCLHDRDQRRPILYREAIHRRLIHRRLREKVSEKTLPPAKLKDRLDPLGESYNLRFLYSDSLPRDTKDKEVKQSGVENRRLWELLVKLLEPAGLGFRVEDDAVVIVPLKEQEKDPDGEKMKEPEKENPKEKDKEKEKDADKDADKEKAKKDD